MGLPLLKARGPADELKKLSDLSRDLAQQYLRSAHATLGQLIRVPNLLGGVSLEREPRRYTRNFLFGDSSMSALAIVWPREIWFDAVGDDRAVKTAEALRAPGYIACTLPSGPNIHQMTNDRSEEAISIHIYGFDHRSRASSVEREYRLASL